MKKFKFRFQSVLTFREHLEKEALNEFSVIYSEYLSIENEIEASIKGRESLLQDSKAFLEQGRLDLLYYRDQARKGLRVKIGKDTIRLQEKSKPLNIAREKLIEASKQKKILERLKDKAKINHHEEYLKEEQQELDEFGAVNYLKSRDYYAI